MEDPFQDADDVTRIMEALFDIRRDVGYVIFLLEEDYGEEAQEDA